MNITFKGFLRLYCRELTNTESDNLSKLLKKTLKDCPSAAEALMLFAASQGKASYLVGLTKGTRLEKEYEDTNKKISKSRDLESFLQSTSAPKRYKKVWNAYIAKRDAIQADRRVILLMRNKILDALQKTNLTIYEIGKNLNLNFGNLYAYINKGDATKVSRDTARIIMEFANNALKPVL